MTKAESNNLKNILVAKQAELAPLVRNREGITIEKSADALEEVQYATERELAIRNLDRESSLLRNVHAALRRIDTGTFGVCLQCEEDISPSVWRQCRGRRSAFGVRKSPTAAGPATARTAARSY